MSNRFLSYKEKTKTNILSENTCMALERTLGAGSGLPEVYRVGSLPPKKKRGASLVEFCGVSGSIIYVSVGAKRVQVGLLLQNGASTHSFFGHRSPVR